MGPAAPPISPPPREARIPAAAVGGSPPGGAATPRFVQLWHAWGTGEPSLSWWRAEMRALPVIMSVFSQRLRGLWGRKKTRELSWSKRCSLRKLTPFGTRRYNSAVQGREWERGEALALHTSLRMTSAAPAAELPEMSPASKRTKHDHNNSNVDVILKKTSARGGAREVSSLAAPAAATAANDDDAVDEEEEDSAPAAAAAAAAAAALFPLLPDDVLARIFRQLDPRSLTNISCVCRSWQRDIAASGAWSMLCSEAGRAPRRPRKPWRQLYFDNLRTAKRVLDESHEQLIMRLIMDPKPGMDGLSHCCPHFRS